jgi:hypothetical protein
MSKFGCAWLAARPLTWMLVLPILSTEIACLSPGSLVAGTVFWIACEQLNLSCPVPGAMSIMRPMADGSIAAESAYQGPKPLAACIESF